MGFDFESHLGAVERSVSSLERDGLPAGAVTLSRSYATTVEDLWDAVTNGERIPRWFLPISGELELGGRYQLEGNAGGVITACNAHHISRSHGSSARIPVGSRYVSRTTESAARGLHSRTPRTFQNTGASTGRARSASAGSWVSWDSRPISRNRPSQCRTKPLSQLRRMVRRSSQAAVRGGRERRQGARPHSTLVNRPSPPDAPALSNLRDSKARPMRVRSYGYGTPRLERWWAMQESNLQPDD